tara:strand:+ start:263 stop:1279 length:1017 start_codon:yes stop_codon:yes gene_type:complete
VINCKSNRQVCLASRPKGLPNPTNWNIISRQIPTIQSGEVLIKVRFISIDPAMRGWMNDRVSYIPPVQIGSVMRALTVGEIVESKNETFKVGDWVSGIDGVQNYAVSDGTQNAKIDLSIAPPQTYLGTLGIAGLTAYSGLLKVGRLRVNDAVLVSGAAGSVGAHVGQIAKIKGNHVVGIAGGSKKCRYLVDELGFDAAIDYKNEELSVSIAQHCPKGIDLFFDNVGGKTLNAGLSAINVGARVVICGAISQYNLTHSIEGPSNYLLLLLRRARMEGFIYFDYHKDWPNMIKELSNWHSSGKIIGKEDIVKGNVDIFPDILLRLFNGENHGKLIIELQN